MATNPRSLCALSFRAAKINTHTLNKQRIENGKTSTLHQPRARVYEIYVSRLLGATTYNLIIAFSNIAARSQATVEVQNKLN